MTFVICFISMCVSVFCIERYVVAINSEQEYSQEKNARYYKLMAQCAVIVSLIMATV